MPPKKCIDRNKVCPVWSKRAWVMLIGREMRKILLPNRRLSHTDFGFS
jgi:hypothetical protein